MYNKVDYICRCRLAKPNVIIYIEDTNLFYLYQIVCRSAKDTMCEYTT